MLRLALLAFVSLFLAGSIPAAEARPVPKKAATKAKPTKKKTGAKKASPTSRKKKTARKKKRKVRDEAPSEPRRPMP